MTGYARAAVMTAAGRDLEMRDFPLPDVPRDAVLVRVRCCTICRSDLHTWTGKRPGPTPAILGHEIVGSIVALGTEVTHDLGDRPLVVGDRITWTMQRSCGSCFYCRDKNLPMKCRTLRKYGHESCAEPPHLNGGFADHCLLEAGTGIVKVPEVLPDVVAAPANCAVATIVAGWDAAGLRAGDNVLIQGAGGLGCYAAAYAAHAGAGRIIAVDVDTRRLDAIRAFGATDCLDASTRSAEELSGHVKAITGGFGVDSALELAGVPSVIPAGLLSLRKGGTYIEIGCSFPKADVTLDASLILWNWLTIRGVHNYDARHLRHAVDFLAATCRKFPYDRLVSAAYDFSEINPALRRAEGRDVLRVAVVMNERSVNARTV